MVSSNGGGPAYGGTPSDASVVAAIADLKARGLKVYLYPFVMMDIADGNALPNPYGGIGQAAYPWRGRVTCHPAAGEAGTADKTSLARAQVAAFCGAAEAGEFVVSGGSVSGGGGDEGYRRLVLHYALLAEAAGGVDGFIIGSELRGLTQLRDGDGRFPFVEQLVALAGDVRAVVGAGTKLTYAADWSEYFGYQPADGSGEVHYNLDPLWASPDIDAVGIDNYMPLSDWRDGDLWEGNPDGFLHGADDVAMRGMIAGGEGFDWYYQDEADRRTRLRTPIVDGLAGKPWVYRYKDLEGWWGNVHRDRIGGVEQAVPSPWVPGSKPIWFTEVGCPAIDKGGNQPNVFVDPKSSENAVPHFSSGGRSDLVQRRFLEAHLAHWAEAGGAVDPDHLFVWTWDARPVPAFPENTDLWADGGNWQTGHWLNGRLGASNAGDVIRAVLADHGFDGADTSAVTGDVTGYVQAEQASAREVLEPLMQALSVDAVEGGGTLRFRSRLKLAARAQAIDVLAEDGDAAPFEETRGHGSDFAGEALIDFFDATADYGRATVRSRRTGAASERVLRLSLPAVLHEGMAAGAVEDALKDHQAGRRQVRFSLSPAALALEPADVVVFEDGPAGLFIVERIEDGTMRRVEARAFQPSENGGGAGAASAGGRPSRSASDAFSPVVMLMDLAQYDGGAATSFARAAVFARPWRTAMLSSSATADGYRLRQRFDRPAKTGMLAAPLGPGVAGRFDWSQDLLVNLDFGGLSSASRIAVLNGQNRVAVQATNGVWEIMGFLVAEEVAAGQWRLRGLLRGLHGTGDAVAAGSGASVVVLDEAVKPIGLGADEAGRPLNFIVEAAGEVAIGPLVFEGGLRAETPVAPVHLKAERLSGGDIRLSWIRCARRDADHWLDGDIALDEAEERYRIDILDGDVVKRRVESGAPFFVYAAAHEMADFGGPLSAISVRVRQVGAKVALGVPTRAMLAV